MAKQPKRPTRKQKIEASRIAAAEERKLAKQAVEVANVNEVNSEEQVA